MKIFAVNPFRTDFETEPDPLLLELVPSFTIPMSGGGTLHHPAYAEVLLHSLPELAGVESIRIDVEPLDGRREYWGFVSVTHNETQSVTLITPKE